MSLTDNRTSLSRTQNTNFNHPFIGKIDQNTNSENNGQSKNCMLRNITAFTTEGISTVVIHNEHYHARRVTTFPIAIHSLDQTCHPG